MEGVMGKGGSALKDARPRSSSSQPGSVRLAGVKPSAGPCKHWPDTAKRSRRHPRVRWVLKTAPPRPLGEILTEAGADPVSRNRPAPCDGPAALPRRADDIS